MRYFLVFKLLLLVSFALVPFAKADLKSDLKNRPGEILPFVYSDFSAADAELIATRDYFVQLELNTDKIREVLGNYTEPEVFRRYLISRISEFFTKREFPDNTPGARMRYAMALFSAFRDESGNSKFRVFAYNQYRLKVLTQLMPDEIAKVKQSLKGHISQALNQYKTLKALARRTVDQNRDMNNARLVLASVVPALFLTETVEDISEDRQGKIYWMAELLEDRGRSVRQRIYPDETVVRTLETMIRFDETNPFANMKLQGLVARFLMDSNADIRRASSRALVDQKDGRGKHIRDLLPTAVEPLSALISGNRTAFPNLARLTGAELEDARVLAITVLGRDGEIAFGGARAVDDFAGVFSLLRNLLVTKRLKPGQPEGGETYFVLSKESLRIRLAAATALARIMPPDEETQDALVAYAFRELKNEGSMQAFNALGAQEAHVLKPLITSEMVKQKLIRWTTWAMGEPEKRDPGDIRVFYATELLKRNPPKDAETFKILFELYQFCPAEHSAKTRILTALNGSADLDDTNDFGTELFPLLVQGATMPGDASKGIRAISLRIMNTGMSFKPQVLVRAIEVADTLEERLLLAGHIKEMSEDKLRRLVALGHEADEVLEKLLLDADFNVRRAILAVFAKRPGVALKAVPRTVTAIIRNMGEDDAGHQRPIDTRIPRLAIGIVAGLVNVGGRHLSVPGNDDVAAQALIAVGKMGDPFLTTDVARLEERDREKRLAAITARGLLEKLLNRRPTIDVCAFAAIQAYLKPAEPGAAGAAPAQPDLPI